MTGAPSVIITGASSGIGLALARAYARDGANLVLNGRDEAKLTAAAASLDQAARIVTVPGDVSDASTAEHLIRASSERFGRVEVLINNAGVFWSKPIAEYDDAEVDGFLRINLRGPILLARAMVKRLRAQGGGGAIINVTSSISLAPQATLPASVPNATKGALSTFTRSLALELAQEGIRVNAVAPGIIKTPLIGASEADFARMAGMQPVGHIGETDDIVAAVQYLARERFVTGVVLPVDGGSSLGRW